MEKLFLFIYFIFHRDKSLGSSKKKKKKKKKRLFKNSIVPNRSYRSYQRINLMYKKNYAVC